MKRSTPRTRSDDGAILIIALVIVTTVALVTGALLTKGSGNFLATVSLRQVAGSAYSGDAAAKVAISDLENGSNSPDVKVPGSFSTPWVYDNYVDGSGCFGASQSGTTLTPTTWIQLPDLYPATGSQTTATSARVECQVVTGSGALGSGQGVPITDLNGVDRALTLLGDGTTTGDGLSVKPLGSGNSNSFLVGGGLASNEKISVSNGALFTDSYAWAHSGCSGTIFSTPAPDCGHATVPDPAYGAATTTVPTYQPIPTGCTFQPGYYDDAKALTAATDACSTSTFAPGTYYFDFHNNTADPTYSAKAVTGSGSDVWTISNTVVGGTTAGSTSPGRCVSPIESTSASGVQFVFGGDSRLYLDNNSVMELCGTYSADAPPIVLFGLNSGAPSSLQSPSGMTPTSVTSTDFSDATMSRLSTADGTAATWSTSGASSSTGTVTMGGMLPAMPAGSLLKSATLQIRHQEAVSGSGGGTNNGNGGGGTNNGNGGGTNNGNGGGGGGSNGNGGGGAGGSDTVTPSLSVKIGSGAATPTSDQPATSNTLTTESLNVTNDLAKAVHDGNGSSVQFLFAETAKGTTSSQLDYAQLTLTYYPPALRPQTTAGYGATNCVSSGSCSFVDTKTNWGGTFVVNGVTYVPTGAVTIDPGNGQGLVAFRYGLFARGLTMKGQPKYQFGYPVVSIPEEGPGFGSNVTVVDLKVYLCSEQSSCPVGSGTLSLTSRVKITDPVNVAPTPNTRKIDVLSWSEQR